MIPGKAALIVEVSTFLSITLTMGISFHFIFYSLTVFLLKYKFTLNYVEQWATFDVTNCFVLFRAQI